MQIGQERIELRFPSLCSEEQEVEEKPPGSQEKANCPDDKVSREYEPCLHVIYFEYGSNIMKNMKSHEAEVIGLTKMSMNVLKIPDDQNYR